MIQNINAKFDNQFKNVSPRGDDYALCFNSRRVLLSLYDNTISLPTVNQTDGVIVYLFSLDGKNYFLCKSSEHGDFKYFDYKVLRTARPKELAFAAVTAFHLNNWYNDSRFCGRCGAAMCFSPTERAMVCDCGNTVYPRIYPAVIVAIISHGKICLTKYNRPGAHWALVAGFCEIGETAEQTVHREVFEETGLKVKNLRYYKSQPWGFTSTLLYGFYCEVDGDDTVNVDNFELKEGKWFLPDEITFDDDDLSLTREMIDKFKRGKINM